MTTISRNTFIKYISVLSIFPKLSIQTEGVIIRPPGSSLDFLSRCIRCGKCVEACPFDSIKFFDIGSGPNLYTPYIDPLDTPCYMCHQRSKSGYDKPISKYLKCGEACPTGAIKLILNKKSVFMNLPDQYKMGISYIDRKLCLAWQYNSCGECYYNCILKDKALRDFPPDYNVTKGAPLRPYIDPNYCIGCGMCSYVCPVKLEVAQAKMKRNYKLTAFEQRYANMVRNLLGKAGKNVKLPAVRVIGKVK